MSSSDAHPNPNLIVRADPGTEVFIVDHSLALRGQGVGGFRDRVEPGLYQVRFRTGSSLDESLVQVPIEGEPTIVSAPAKVLESAAPFWATSPAHFAVARDASRRTHADLGQGSGIFIFARCLGGQVRGYVHPAQGLELRSMDNERVADLTVTAEHGVESDLPWAGCSVSVTPGRYRLRASSAWGAQEQIVVASPGWQTQVFLLQEWTDPATISGPGSPTDGDVDVSATTILMAPLDRGFESSMPEDNQSELTRIALDTDRSVLSPDDLTSLLNSKFINPMLGILGAHALAGRDDPDLERLTVVINNLRVLVPDHPDVEALALAAGLPVEATWDTPPMLTSSWRMVVKQSIERPDLIPVGSLSARIPQHLWGGGLWLMWDADALEASPSEDTDPTVLTDSVTFQQIYDVLTAVTNAVASATETPGLTFSEEVDVPDLTGVDLTGVDQTVLSWVNDIVHRTGTDPAPSVGLADLLGPPTVGDQVSPREVQGVQLIASLAEAMQLPSTTMLSIAAELTDKLGTAIEDV